MRDSEVGHVHAKRHKRRRLLCLQAPALFHLHLQLIQRSPKFGQVTFGFSRVQRKVRSHLARNEVRG